MSCICSPFLRRPGLLCCGGRAGIQRPRRCHRGTWSYYSRKTADHFQTSSSETILESCVQGKMQTKCLKWQIICLLLSVYNINWYFRCTLDFFNNPCIDHKHDQVCIDCQNFDDAVQLVLEKITARNLDNQDAFLFNVIILEDQNWFFHIIQTFCHILMKYI